MNSLRKSYWNRKGSTKITQATKSSGFLRVADSFFLHFYTDGAAEDLPLNQWPPIANRWWQARRGSTPPPPIFARTSSLCISHPLAPRSGDFFFAKNTPKGASRVQGMRLGTGTAQARPRHVPPTWRCPRKAVADPDPAIGSNHGQARLTQTRPGLALSLQHRLSCPKQAYNRSTKPGNTGAAPRDQQRSNPSAHCHLPLTKNRKSANIWTGHGTRNPTLARTCAYHKQNLPRNDRASRACATVA